MKGLEQGRGAHSKERKWIQSSCSSRGWSETEGHMKKQCERVCMREREREGMCV